MPGRGAVVLLQLFGWNQGLQTWGRDAACQRHSLAKVLLGDLTTTVTTTRTSSGKVDKKLRRQQQRRQEPRAGRWHRIRTGLRNGPRKWMRVNWPPLWNAKSAIRRRRRIPVRSRLEATLHRSTLHLRRGCARSIWGRGRDVMEK